MFEETKKSLDEYEKLYSKKPSSYDEEFKCACAALDISKSLVYDLGYENACKLAKGILALEQLHPMR